MHLHVDIHIYVDIFLESIEKNVLHRRLEMTIYSQNLILRFRGSFVGQQCQIKYQTAFSVLCANGYELHSLIYLLPKGEQR